MTAQHPVFAHLSGIIASIDADLMLPLRAHEREDRGGFFGISRQVFSYIDYLGALACNGTCGMNNAVWYMEKYFIRTDSAYTGKCKLLYSMWRHGTVHEYDPQVFVSGKHGFVLRWGANNTSRLTNRKWHLKCLCRASTPNSYNWFINLFELVDDLKNSVERFIQDLSNEEYLRKVTRNFNKLSEPVNLDCEQRSLVKEALRVVEATAGVIDDQGNVIREFSATTDLDEYKRNDWRKE
jgi:hypothetical protein